MHLLTYLENIGTTFLVTGGMSVHEVCVKTKKKVDGTLYKDTYVIQRQMGKMQLC